MDYDGVLAEEIASGCLGIPPTLLLKIALPMSTLSELADSRPPKTSLRRKKLISNDISRPYLSGAMDNCDTSDACHPIDIES